MGRLTDVLLWNFSQIVRSASGITETRCFQEGARYHTEVQIEQVGKGGLPRGFPTT